MGRWVIVGFLVLAGVVFVLTRPPSEQTGAEPESEPSQSAAVPESATAGQESDSAADTTGAAPTGETGRYDFAKRDASDESSGGQDEGSPWTQGRDGFDPPRIDPEALRLLENPPAPIPPPNWDEISTHRYVYPDHIEALIDGTGESRHEEAVEDFVRENPPGPGGYPWSEVDAAFEEAERRQAKTE